MKLNRKILRKIILKEIKKNLFENKEADVGAALQEIRDVISDVLGKGYALTERMYSLNSKDPSDTWYFIKRSGVSRGGGKGLILQYGKKSLAEKTWKNIFYKLSHNAATVLIESEIIEHERSGNFSIGYRPKQALPAGGGQED